MKDAEKSIVGNGDPYSFKSRLENLPDNVVVIGSHTHTDSRKEKVYLVLFFYLITLDTEIGCILRHENLWSSFIMCLVSCRK